MSFYDRPRRSRAIFTAVPRALGPSHTQLAFRAPAGPHTHSWAREITAVPRALGPSRRANTPLGVEAGTTVFFTQGDKRHRCVCVCVCGVSSTAFKAHRRPKKHSSPGVPRNRHSCYTWISVGTSRRPFIVSLVWLPLHTKIVWY